MIGNAVYILTSSSKLGITPLLFIPTALSLLWSIKNFRFLDVFLIGRKEVFEKMKDAVLVLDQEGRIVDLNQSGEELIREITPYSTGIGKSADEVFSEELGSLEPLGPNEESNVEFELDTGGKKRRFQARVTSFRAEEGRDSIGKTMIIRDVTKRTSVKRRKEFLGTLLTQDVRNKVGTSIGWMELLSESGLSKKQKSHLEKAIWSAKETMDLVGLVEEARDTEGETDVFSKDLKDVLEGVVREHDEDVGDGIEIELNLREDNIAVLANYMLKSAFKALIRTAVHQRDSERIAISTKETDGEAVVMFDDDGREIPDEIKKEISAGTYTGSSSGVGGSVYFVVREIIEILGGDFEIRGSDLDGVQVRVYLKKS